MKTNYEFRGSHFRKQGELQTWTQQVDEPVLEPDLPIIDPHHHVWNDGRGRYLIEELLADINSGHNIIATVFIEAGAMLRKSGPEEEKAVGEIEFANGIAAMSASGHYGATRLCSGLIGYADLARGDAVRPVLEQLIAAGNGRFRGIRQGVTWDSGPASKFGARHVLQHQLLDPVFRLGFAHLQALGLSFEAWQFYPQLPDVADLARAFPDTSIIVNHAGGILGLPPHNGKRDEVFHVWRENLRALAQYPNLSIKLGGLGMLYCDWDFHLRDVPPGSEELATLWRPYIETCIELFGPGRAMMESNFPVDKQSCGYGVLWNAMKRITAQCSAAEKAALYRDTAARVYRLAV